MASAETAILTFNCGRELADPAVLAGHLSRALASRPVAPELLVLSLQEVAPIAHSFLGGAFLAPYLQRYIAAVAWFGARWRRDGKAPGPGSGSHGGSSGDSSPGDGSEPPYVLLAARNVGMTALLAFARSDRADQVRGLRSAGVGVGWLETGNKGCVALRLDFAEHQLTFLAAHLAPMEWDVARRNHDWRRVIEGLVFPGSAAAGAGAAGEEQPLLGRERESGVYDTAGWVFVAGDLNYRTSDTGPSPEQSAAFGMLTAGPAAREALLEGDQLRRERAAGNALHGFAEMAVRFEPTYKHSAAARRTAQAREEAERRGEDLAPPGEYAPREWSGHRWPSWCDRVLFWRGGLADPAGWLAEGKTVYTALPLLSTSDHQPVVLAAAVPLAPEGEVDEHWVPPFAIDPAWRQRRDAARRREIGIGALAYLSLTWEGNGLMLAAVVGALGGWVLIRGLLEG